MPQVDGTQHEDKLAQQQSIVAAPSTNHMK